MAAEKKPELFVDAVEEHSVEGLDILMGTSPLLARGVIYIMVLLCVAAFAWSFFGKADVIVSSNGLLDSETGTTRVYSPTNGELVDLYVAEGMAVSKGDVLARLKAPAAIQAATAALRAKLQFEQAERELRLFPRKRVIMETEVRNIKRQITQLEKQYEQLKTDGLRKLSAAQKNKLNKVRLEVAAARTNMERARKVVETFKRLYETTGHGGVSKKQIGEKEAAYRQAEGIYRGKLNTLQGLEFEFSERNIQTGTRIDQLYLNLLNTRLQYENKQQGIGAAEKAVEAKYREARGAWEAAARVTLEDLDEEDFLKIRAPVSGRISQVGFINVGEKVRATAPLVSIAPAGAAKILRIRIADKDRGFLREGQQVKLKFAAFPYQRYGFIKGTLAYISPVAKPAPKGQQQGRPLFEGRISLEKEYFEVEGEKVPLTFGMTARAEIVVQKRRMIDLALDPFRRLKR